MAELEFHKTFYTEAIAISKASGYNIRMESENKGNPPATKRYPFKFSPLMLGLFLLGLMLCFAGFGLTTWRFYNFLQDGGDSIYGWIQYVLLYFVSTFLAVLIIAMLIRSQYLITDKHLIMQFGIIRSKYELKTVYSVHLFKGSNKLAVYFDDFQTKYMVIVVKDSWYDDFVQTLLERNPSIGFSFSTAEEEDEIKKK